MGTTRIENTGATEKTASTRKNGQMMGDSQAAICASLNEINGHLLPDEPGASIDQGPGAVVSQARRRRRSFD
ncbi:MAG: hypothetical protein ACK543_13725 [Acidovorax sp.]